MKKYILSSLLFLVLLLITYFFIFKECDFNLLFTSLKSTNPFYIFLTIICVSGYVLLGSLFLKRILKHFNHQVSFMTSLGYMFTEIYFSSITPSYIGGQPVQMLEMKKDGIPYEKSSVIVLFNSMMNRISLIIVASILLLIFHKEILSLNKIYTILVLLGFCTTLLVIFVFALVIYSKKSVNLIIKLGNFIIDHFKFIKNKSKLKNKLKESLASYQKCAKMTKDNPKIIRETLIILIIQRLCLLLSCYTVYLSFGLNKYSAPLVMALGVCVTLGSDLMPTPGGVMVNESLLLVVNKMLYGENLALSGMLMLRSFNFYFLVIISALYYLIFHYRKKNTSKNLVIKN